MEMLQPIVNVRVIAEKGASTDPYIIFVGQRSRKKSFLLSGVSTQCSIAQLIHTCNVLEGHFDQ